MTAGQLKERLARHPDELEVQVRCMWVGDRPPANVFRPRLVIQEVEPDTGDDTLVIECDQDFDE